MMYYFDLYFYDFLALAFAHFIALLSPGADFFLLISNSSRYGRISGFLTALGISLANLFYILLALLGISSIKDNETIFLSIKLLGSFYLIYIAFHLIKASKRKLFKKEKEEKSFLLYKAFFQGFLSALLNPKNSIFYFTMFSISLQSHTPFVVQSFYALWLFLAVLLWDFFIVYLVSHKKAKNFIEKYSNKIEKVSGFILLVLALFIIKESFI